MKSGARWLRAGRHGNDESVGHSVLTKTPQSVAHQALATAAISADQIAGAILGIVFYICRCCDCGQCYCCKYYRHDSRLKQRQKCQRHGGDHGDLCPVPLPRPLHGRRAPVPARASGGVLSVFRQFLGLKLEYDHDEVLQSDWQRHYHWMSFVAWPGFWSSLAGARCTATDLLHLAQRTLSKASRSCYSLYRRLYWAHSS
jgi:hypothetical protein